MSVFHLLASFVTPSHIFSYRIFLSVPFYYLSSANELHFLNQLFFKKFFYWGGVMEAFQASFFSAAPELDCSLQIQLIFRSFVQLFTVFLRVKPGKEHYCISPVNLNSWTILLISALQVSPSPSGWVFLQAPPAICHPWGLSPPSVLLLFVSASAATTQFQLLLAALTGVAESVVYICLLVFLKMTDSSFSIFGFFFLSYDS